MHKQLSSIFAMKINFLGGFVLLILTVTALAAVPEKTPALAGENAIASIIETKVICREPGKYLGEGTQFKLDRNGHQTIGKRVIEPDRYMGWATVAKTQTGELIVAFSGDRDSHVCPWGKTQIIRSSDQGRTWSEPQTINNTPLDDRDAGIIQTKSGALLVSFFTSTAFMSPVYKTAFERYVRHAEQITPEVKEKWLGNWTIRSEDGGQTWQEPVRTVTSAPHGPIQLDDGRLLYVGFGVSNRWTTIHVEQSSDDGRTWHVISTIPKPQDIVEAISEPHVVELASGKLIAMVRHEPKDRQCFLLQSESLDGGRTWSPLHKTDIWGYPPHMIQLKNGWVLVAYGYRKEPFSERACISRDEGKTWDVANEIMLTPAVSPDHGYPSSVQLDDGSILTVYYQAEKLGKPTVLMGTLWKLK